MKLAEHKKFTKEQIPAGGAASDDCFPAQLWVSCDSWPIYLTDCSSAEIMLALRRLIAEGF